MRRRVAVVAAGWRARLAALGLRPGLAGGPIVAVATAGSAAAAQPPTLGTLATPRYPEVSDRAAALAREVVDELVSSGALREAAAGERLAEAMAPLVRFELWMWLREVVRLEAGIERIVEETGPKRLVVAGGGRALAAAAAAVAERAGVELETTATAAAHVWEGVRGHGSRAALLARLIARRQARQGRPKGKAGAWGRYGQGWAAGLRAGGPSPVVLCAAAHEHQAAQALPVLEELRGRGWQIVLADCGHWGDEERVAARPGLARGPLLLGSYGGRAAWLRAWRIARRLRDLGARRLAVGAVAELGSELGSALWGAALRSVVLLEQLGALLADVRPDVVLALDEGLVGRGLAVAARQAGVPSVYLEHGVLGPYPLAGDLDFTRLALFGAGSAERLATQGLDRRRVAVTGCAAYDCLARRLPSAPPRPPRGTATLSFLSSWCDDFLTPAVKAKGCRWLATAIGRLGCPVRLTVKLHPLERDGIAAACLAEALALPGSAVTSAPVAELAAASDLVVAFWSTAILEAVVLGRPAVMLNPTGAPDPLPFAASGAVLVARSQEEAAAAVRAALMDAAARERLWRARAVLLGHELGVLDGCAAGRVADLVETVAGLAPRAVACGVA